MVGGISVAQIREHVQCRLRKDNSIMVAWIPKVCAVLGKTVDLNDPEHGEALGWEVIAVGSTSLDSKWVNERSRDHQNMRKMTDI
jgi:hypothetical protein